jgi:xanthine dehydrogenase YagR molybdenum-binding subunit
MSILDSAKQAVMGAIVRLTPDAAPDPLIGRHGAVGSQLSRIDGPLKVAGKARFAAEVPYDDLLFAAVLFSSVARGRIALLDTSGAEAAQGVTLVMTYRNAPRMGAPKIFGESPMAAGPSNLTVMQDDRIHWNGQPVAVVLAETQEQADHAKSLIRITYDIEPAVTSFEAAKAGAHPPESILGEAPTLEIGDAEAALVDAEFSVDNLYQTPRHNHNAIELHAVTVAWDDDNLTIHDASQMVHQTAWTIADMFGIGEDKVRVMSPFVGGGFGGKCMWYHQVLAAAASKLAERPVRLVLSREGVFRSVGGRTCTEQRVALGSRADGSLAALIHTGVVAMTTHNNCPEQFSFPARHLYAADAIKLAQEVADMDMLANTFMRAPGESVGTFALESAIDELAIAMNIDPIELRRRWEPEKDPTSGAEFSSRHIVEAYRCGAERFGWHRRNPVPRSMRDGEWLIGHGVATATYPYYRMPGAGARITLSADGHALVQIATHEMGMGTATVQVQHAADRLGLPIHQVSFEYGDTTLPMGTIAGGSNQTASVVAAVRAASDALFDELLQLAGNSSPLAGLKAEELEARDRGLASIHDPARAETYTAILKRAGRDELAIEAAAPAPIEVQKYSMHSYGAQFCEVRVNEVTGETRVSRFLGSFDTGRILNPKTAASQFRGGIIMGLGLALTEETMFDERTGRIMNPSLAEYHVPVHLDVPHIEVIWNDIPDPHSPLGLHGIGEIGITGVGAAVANAIFNATGKRIRELPITLDKLL